MLQGLAGDNRNEPRAGGNGVDPPEAHDRQDESQNRQRQRGLQLVADEQREKFALPGLGLVAVEEQRAAALRLRPPFACRSAKIGRSADFGAVAQHGSGYPSSPNSCPAEN